MRIQTDREKRERDPQAPPGGMRCSSFRRRAKPLRAGRQRSGAGAGRSDHRFGLAYLAKI